MRSLSFLAAVIAVAGGIRAASAGELLDDPVGISPELTQQVVSDVSDAFADPESVQIRRIRASSDTGSICGQYNAKNTYGGYVGFKTFKYIVERRKVYITVTQCS